MGINYFLFYAFSSFYPVFARCSRDDELISCALCIEVPACERQLNGTGDYAADRTGEYMTMLDGTNVWHVMAAPDERVEALGEEKNDNQPSWGARHRQ